MEHGVVAVRYVTNNYRFLYFRKNPKYPGFKLLQGQQDGVVISPMTYTFLFFCKHKKILGMNYCRDWSMECDKSNVIDILVVVQKSKISRV